MEKTANATEYSAITGIIFSAFILVSGIVIVIKKYSYENIKIIIFSFI
ncbi:hypothetical protein [Clostridium pasteurianum]|nr:hypothetical protein [Clostridium pasteurianum]